MHRIVYTEKIRKRGWLGIPYTVLKVRTAHLDDRDWPRMKGRPFSMGALMRLECAPDR